MGNINLETAYNGSVFQCLTQKPFIQTGNVWLFHQELTVTIIPFQLVILGEEISPDDTVRPNLCKYQTLGTYFK